MKITETQLRKLIRKVILKEFTSGGTGLAGRKLHKGRKSTALQTAEKGATDAKKAMEKALKEKEAARTERDAEKTARDTKRTAFISKDTDYTTKGSKYTVDNTDYTSKTSTYNSKVTEDATAAKALADHRKVEPNRYASYEWSPKELKKAIKVKAQIVRAIPLPPISLGVGPIPIYPPNKQIKFFFDKIGKTIEIADENQSLNFWTMSSMMAPYYEMLNYLSNWLNKKGINKIKAENYITSLFLGLSENAYKNKYKNLKELVKKSQTPKGLNEQALKELKKIEFYKKLNSTSNIILKRLKGK